MPNRAVSLTTIWASSFLLMAVVIGLVIDAPHLLVLRKRGAETIGNVARVIPESHGLVVGQFEISAPCAQPRSMQR